MTLAIIAFTVVISLLAFRDRRIFEQLVFDPFTIAARRDWFRFVTHAFLHAHVPHLMVNMLVLFFFGSSLERALGAFSHSGSKLSFLLLYLGGAAFAAMPSYKRHMHDPGYRAVGASGAVSAVLFAAILVSPTKEIGHMLFPLVGVPGWIFGPLYLAYEYYLDKKGNDNVAHDAHFYGALFGLGFMTILRPSLWPELFQQIGIGG